jgi:hypothetical protein
VSGSSSLFMVRVVDGLKKGWRGLSRDEALRVWRVGMEFGRPSLWRSIWVNILKRDIKQRSCDDVIYRVLSGHRMFICKGAARTDAGERLAEGFAVDSCFTSPVVHSCNENLRTDITVIVEKM